MRKAVNVALLDPDTARAGRLWEKLWAEHEAVGRATTETEGDVWKLLDDAYDAVEAERRA